jgi:hypothetical protein
MDSRGFEEGSSTEKISDGDPLSTTAATDVPRNLEDGRLPYTQGRDAVGDGGVSAGSHGGNTDHPHHHEWSHLWRDKHHHLWTAKKMPHRSTHAHALARAEAASWAQMTPLIAATLGPMSILLGIPSLTQRWHGQLLDPPVGAMGASNFVALPDPAVNLALAAVAVFCEFSGNALLILRFSNFHTKITTWMSYAFWIAKLIIGVANYIQFGLHHPQTDTIIYLQGFWVLIATCRD